MDENTALGHKGCFPLRGAGSNRMSSLLIFGENDAPRGNIVWQEKEKSAELRGL